MSNTRDETAGAILVVTSDAVASRKIEAAAATLGRPLDVVGSLAEAAEATEPAALVVDLDLPDAADAPRRLRERWPRALIAAFVSTPDRGLWEGAVDAGYDLVATRGTIAARLRDSLRTWTGPSSARRFKLFDAGDVVGRLGVLARMEDTPVGPVAVYRIGRDLLAAADRCPHAGARLSEGALEDGVVTCPNHGSRFDVRTGERVRGPADDPIRVFPVVVEAGTVYLEYD